MPQKNRYSRQLLVPQFGSEGQKRIHSAKVLIVGVGGLGCQIAAQLAGAGVGTLVLVDHDLVSISNLHRQILFREPDIGKSKALVAQRELQALNSDIMVKGTHKRLTPDSIDRLLETATLVVDAADNFATSYLISDACHTRKLPMVSASVNRSFGFVGVFCGLSTTGQTTPSFRALFAKLPKEQLSCDTVGVTGPSVGIIANIQAQESLKVILADPHALFGKLLYADLWQYNLHTIDFSKAKEPSGAQIKIISQSQLDENDIVIDVRSQEEIKEQPQPFPVTLEIPMQQIGLNTINLCETQRVVCVCASGQRALIAAQQIKQHGHNKVAALLPNSE